MGRDRDGASRGKREVAHGPQLEASWAAVKKLGINVNFHIMDVLYGYHLNYSNLIQIPSQPPSQRKEGRKEGRNLLHSCHQFANLFHVLLLPRPCPLPVGASSLRFWSMS